MHKKIEREIQIETMASLNPGRSGAHLESGKHLGPEEGLLEVNREQFLLEEPGEAAQTPTCSPGTPGARV